MKKNLTLLIVLCLTITLYSCQTSKYIDKIIYEDREIINASMTETSFSQDEIVKQQEVVQVHLDTEIMEPYNPESISYNAYLSKCESYYYESNLSKLKTLDISGYDEIYVSKYAPIIEYVYQSSTFSRSRTSTMSINTNDAVKVVYVKQYNDLIHSNLIDIATDSKYLNIETEYNNRTVTGNGVKVGILEAGEVDEDDEAFEDITIVVKPKFSLISLKDQHTTEMAKFIGGKYGIASEASLYSAFLDGTPVDEVDWFLENEVKLINMSYGDPLPTGVYSSESAYYDYIAKQYGVLFVAACGNSGDTTTGYITNPALGYNVLAVGASNSYHYLAYFSSYNSVNGPEKPNLVAPGFYINVPGTSRYESGTSISSALTTGVIACLYEKCRIYLNYPEKVIALLMATAEKMNNQDLDTSSGLDDMYGAGEVDYGDACANARNAYVVFNYDKPANTLHFTNFYALGPGQSIDICIVTFANSDGTIDNHSYTDYDIYLYDDTNMVGLTATASSNNIECLHYTNNTDNAITCKVQIYQDGVCANSGEIIGFAERTKYYE